MNIFFFIFFILLCILFIPIPLKLYFSLVEYKFSIKLYNFQLYPQAKTNKKTQKKVSIKTKFKKFNFIKKEELSYSFFKDILIALNNRKFKPRFTLLGDINYSCGDPKDTAISFGVVHSFLPYIYRGISILFKCKKGNLKINPSFNNSIFIEFNIQCIMKVSLGQLIYVIIIFIKKIYIKRRCSP